MWGEYADNTNVVATTWPRASAVAERLWSAQTVVDQADAERRISLLQCRLVRRGIPAMPINGASFCPQEFVPPYNPPWQN